jgi:hypothetical protein
MVVSGGPAYCRVVRSREAVAIYIRQYCQAVTSLVWVNSFTKSARGSGRGGDTCRVVVGSPTSFVSVAARAGLAYGY